jgi:small subunit ribosomal protein S18
MTEENKVPTPEGQAPAAEAPKESAPPTAAAPAAARTEGGGPPRREGHGGPRREGGGPGGRSGGPRREGGGPGGPRKGKRQFFRKRKVCKFCVERLDYIDYKKPEMLREFVQDRGKILPRRITGTCSRHQRWLHTAIQRARNIALLPFGAGM